jgi:hypothetical protein
MVREMKSAVATDQATPDGAGLWSFGVDRAAMNDRTYPDSCG